MSMEKPATAGVKGANGTNDIYQYQMTADFYIQWMEIDQK